MKPSSNSPIETVTGLIEKVAFFNEETGFAVLKVKVPKQRDLVTVVGQLPAVSAGEWLTAEGNWRQNRDYGPELQAIHLRSSPPTTREGIEKYLGSGLVKGIGPVYAKKLVVRFGELIFDIIEQFSARLEEVDGIGPKRRKIIKAAWDVQKVVRQIMVFLHSHGVSTSRAVRIHKVYGEKAIEQVRQNPYALARDIPGIGFKTADQIALKSGIPPNSLLRAEAALNHLLQEAAAHGHCALPVQDLLTQAYELLAIEENNLPKALDRSVQSGDLVREFIPDGDLVYLPYLKQAEEEIAQRIKTLRIGGNGYPRIDLEKAMAWYQEKTGQILANTQRAAVELVVSNRSTIITGGPGVGKTTIVKAILSILCAKKVRCLLCAPTGRAAKRLSETTGQTAKTIHRLLEIKGPNRFERNENNPLEVDLLIVDECSMVDVCLMQHLLRAVPPGANLLLVGDVDQLPSVGPGAVLASLIQSGLLPVVTLTEVFRQAAHSQIILNAHRINQGLLPETTPKGIDTDFYFVERETPDSILQLVLEMVKTRIPAKLGCDPVRDIQVLCPMNRGSLGVREMNQRLQEVLNPPQEGVPQVEKYGTVFRVGDKVIQMQNDYDKEVFNGDIGQITEIDSVDQAVRVLFDQREALYEFGELDEMALAYAVTIHKSQGSEFPVVVIPLAMQHYVMLQRNLVYTGITRGRRLVLVAGQKKALAMAVKNQRQEPRHSGLLARLRFD